MNRSELVIILAVLASNLIVLGGCAYAVFWLGHSGWWFLLAVLLLDTVKRTKGAKS